MGIFKSNDIRGVFPEELSLEICYRIGFYLPGILECGKILVGRDGRTSSDGIFKYLAAGINDSGADVVDIGVCDTPAVYFATSKYGFCGSVMITASHNPPEYNGMKISGKGSVPIGPGTGLELLEEKLEETPVPGGSSGKIITLDIRNAYAEHIRRFLFPSRKLKVVFDASNGAAGTFLESVLTSGLIDYSVIGGVVDGTFPLHSPNPLEKESWKRIDEEIRKNNADLGIMFDGDGDRAVFFDEKGHFVSPDIITALLSEYYRDKVPSPWKMFYDVRSSRSVGEYVEKQGGTPVVCGTGHAKIKKLLKDQNGVYAGELSGHYYFRDNFFCDSGFIAAAIVLSIISGKDVPFSKIAGDINPYFFSGEINFNFFDYEKLILEIRKKYSGGMITSIDGIRVDFDNWWFILRLSGAESVLRLVIEADSRRLLNGKIDELSRLISGK